MMLIHCQKVFTRLMIFCYILDIPFFHINPHMRKCRTDQVAIFKLLLIFSWSPSNQKSITPSKVYTSKKVSKKVNFSLYISAFSLE